ncbi:MAG TPA: DUF2975 domain-containing protein [Allosphingosinicella sp.]|nr:DUF2975 domain-containing protein [Allosphingosinicella sp.]
MSQPSAALAASRLILRALIVLNLVCAVLFALLLLLSAFYEDRVLAALQGNEIGPPADVLGASRLVLAIALATVPFAHLLLSRLRAIVESVRAGAPFVADNARRLKAIAWLLLVLQLIDLAYGILVMSLAPMTDELDWSFSLTGWLAVLLLFVLAGVFREGTRMSEDLEGTI